MRSRQGKVLLSGRLALFGLRYRRDELGTATFFYDLLGGLPRGIKFPVTRGVFVRRIEDRLLEEAVIHGGDLLGTAFTNFRVKRKCFVKTGR